MEIMFGLPLSVYALVRYLEGQRIRHLVAFLAGLLAAGHRRVVLRGHPRHGTRRPRPQLRAPPLVRLAAGDAAGGRRRRRGARRRDGARRLALLRDAPGAGPRAGRRGRRGARGGRAHVPDDERNLAGEARPHQLHHGDDAVPGPRGAGARRARGRLDPGRPSRRAAGRVARAGAPHRDGAERGHRGADGRRPRPGPHRLRVDPIALGHGLRRRAPRVSAGAGRARGLATLAGRPARPAPDARGVGAGTRQHGALRVPPLARPRRAGRPAGRPGPASTCGSTPTCCPSGPFAARRVSGSWSSWWWPSWRGSAWRGS